MSESFEKLIAKHLSTLPAERATQLSRELGAVYDRLAGIVSSIDPLTRRDFIRDMPVWLRQELIRVEVEAIKATAEKPTPEVLEWAMQEFNEEEFVDGIRDIERTGGLELRDSIHELKEIAASHE